jgi:bacterioferritin (cytochrome b1)
MISRSIVYEKVQDLLILEVRASELYKEAFNYPESAKYRDLLSEIMNEELEHFDRLKRVIELIRPEAER